MNIKSQTSTIAMELVPMGEAILTITIPTYNRAECLQLLLSSIAKQIGPVHHLVNVIVVDNHSSDGTQACCEQWLQDLPGLVYIRNETNIGMSQNIIKCYELTETKYSWIIGDDDVLRIGVLPQIVKLLATRESALVFMNTIPFQGTPKAEIVSFNEKIFHWNIDSNSFSRLVHIYTTFLSGMITNKNVFMLHSSRKKMFEFEHTVLPQLSWALYCLRYGDGFIYIPQKLVLARVEGSGGYNLYKTFSVDYANILNAALSLEMRRVFKRRTLLNFLPGLILLTRKKRIGNFTVHRHEESYFKEAYSSYVLYWILILPMLRLPMPLCLIFYYSSRVMSKSLIAIDRICARPTVVTDE